MDSDRIGDSSSIEERHGILYSTFRDSANSLTELYSHSMGMQKYAFQDGKQHALEQLESWMFRKLQGGVNLTIEDIFVHIEKLLYPLRQACEESEEQTIGNQSEMIGQQIQGSSVVRTEELSPIRDDQPHEAPTNMIGNVDDDSEENYDVRRMHLDLNVPYNPDAPEYFSVI